MRMGIREGPSPPARGSAHARVPGGMGQKTQELTACWRFGRALELRGFNSGIEGPTSVKRVLVRGRHPLTFQKTRTVSLTRSTKNVQGMAR